MRQRRHRLLFTLAALAVFFGSAEALLRYFRLDRTSQERFYDNIFDPMSRMVPGAENPFSAVIEHMNSRGMRGPDFAKHKAPGVFRIVCLGSSSTFGMGDFGNSYPKVLDELLNEGGRRKRFEVINAGIPGTSLYQQRLHFESLFEGAGPDMVILMTGPNYEKDLKVYRDMAKTPFFRTLMGVHRVLAHSALYRFLRLRLAGRPARRVLNDSELGPGKELPREIVKADYLEDLWIMHSLAMEWGFRLVFVRSIDRSIVAHIRDAGLRPEQPDYCRKAAEMHPDQELNRAAEKWNVPLIDISGDFVARDTDTPDLWHGLGHPGILGNNLIARRIAAELRRLRLLPED